MFAFYAQPHRAVLPLPIVGGALGVFMALALQAGGATDAVGAGAGNPATEVPSEQEVIDAWLQRAGVEGQRADALRAGLASLPQSEGFDLADLERQLRTLAPVDARIEKLLAQIDQGDPDAAPPDWLSADGPPPALRSNIAVRAAAEHFVRRRYEECLTWLGSVGGEACSARELALYYRTVANHQLVRLQPAAEAADELLAIDAPRMRRSHEMARLVKRDAEAHQAGSLTHIAQQMNDVERRLSLGRAGAAEQALQQDVIDAIDKLIEDAEQQRRRQQQRQQQLSQGGRSMAPKPLEQSRPTEMKGAGEVDQRNITPGGDWGSLPPAERERVTQGIIRDFPAHYREVIEDYFRSLAEEGRSDEGAP